jgi:hypothetical protein
MLVIPRYTLRMWICDLKDKNYGSANAYQPFDS